MVCSSPGTTTYCEKGQVGSLSTQDILSLEISQKTLGPSAACSLRYGSFDAWMPSFQLFFDDNPPKGFKLEESRRCAAFELRAFLELLKVPVAGFRAAT